MNEDTGSDYISPWALSECVNGGGVGVVESSHHDAFSEGDTVTSFFWRWQTHDVVEGSRLQKVRLHYLVVVVFATHREVVHFRTG